MSFDIHPANPIRPVDWRWKRAVALVDSGKRYPSRVRDDDYINRARRFYKKLLGADTGDERLQVAEYDPELFMAYTMYQSDTADNTGSAEDRNEVQSYLFRYQIEARALARQNPEEIAKKSPYDAGTVEAYLNIFFDVESRIDMSDFILYGVIGPSIQTGLNEREFDVLWKLFAYLGGAYLLESLIDTSNSQAHPQTAGQIETFMNQDSSFALRRKAMVSARSMAVNSFTQREIMELHLKNLELESNLGAAEAKDQIQANIKEMFAGIQWRLGDYGDKGEGVVNESDNSPVELRSDELLAAGLGKKVDFDSVKDLKYPEIKDDQTVKAG